ncbi:MAG TPA: tetratricopeptide repeat protein, partial [Microthrixaceae bacterium]|nr:tetratricopeptide repeat protein [Microthrixaceae bacterium]
RLGEANTLHSLGNLELQESRNDTARDLYNQALPIYRTIRNRRGEADTLHALGFASEAMNDEAVATAGVRPIPPRPSR